MNALQWIIPAYGDQHTAQELPATDDAQCPHLLLIPHWSAIEDMGIEDKIFAYRCNECGETFAPTEADEIRCKRRPIP